MTILFLSLLSFSFLPQSTIVGSESGQPAHYIVFEKHSDGTIAPVYYRQVELDDPLQSVAESQLAGYLAIPSRNGERMVVALQAKDESIVYQDVVEISPWLRGEFHGAAAGDPIDGHILPDENPAFVVRVPRIEGTALLMKDPQLSTIVQFDLARLASETPLITIDPHAEVESQSIAGPAANRVDFLIMGDGYTEAQSDKFNTDATNIANNFFLISPYSDYQNYFNIYNLFTASSQSGADHPPYNPSCGYDDTNCCGDSEMLTDPLHGQMVNTAFDSRFCANWIHRLLVVDKSKVMAAAAAVPDWDTIIVIVNDATYGGSGGTLSVISTHSAATQIAQHEFGHSFVNLADEYETAYPGYPPCSDITGPACESNVTDVTDRLQIKWNPWILPTTPIPTPETSTYTGLVGLFEGARYLSTGMYRSGLNCIMLSLGSPFCQVPSQSFVMKLYNGGWGVPSSGISLIEPGTAFPVTPLLLTHPATQLFHADILEPGGGPPVQISWLDNGIPIPGTSDNTLSYSTSASSPGLHHISLHVKDMTSLVHSDMAGTALDDEYTWDVTVFFPSITTITSDDPDPSVVGQAIVVSYTVTSADGTPTGNMTVSDGVDSCTATVAAGTCTLTPTTAGAKTLTATYSGDANFSSSSGTASHVVKSDSIMTITSDDPDPSVVGQAIVVSYTVTSADGTPTGNVTVSDGVDSCTATVAAGTCTLTPTTAGAKTLTATYAGDANFNVSSSAGALHMVHAMVLLPLILR